MIWLNEQRNSKIITESKIVITDYEKYTRLKEELLNEENYILIKQEILQEYQMNQRQLKVGSHFIDDNYKTLNTTTYNSILQIYLSTIYENTKNESLNLLIEAINQNKNQKIEFLKFLNSGLKNINNLEKEITNLDAFNTISNIFNSNLDKQTSNTILQTIWPDFYFFSTKILDCIDFKPIAKYNMNNPTLGDYDNFKVTTDYIEALKNSELAKTNTRVLKLAKKINKVNKL